MEQKLKMGMIGGGVDSFIGSVHRMAAMLDNKIELVCGAFSSTPERSRQSGELLSLPADRVYGTYQEMIEKEKNLAADKRMDFVAIVTPNNLHFPPAKMALENGFHVMCDKPMTLNLAEAKELQRIVEKSGLLFGLTHNYTGYPMVKQARHIVQSGQIGKVRKVVVEYLQGWLTTKLEDSKHKQAGWRVDPSQSGASCSMGDIGTHAENLSEYITGLKIQELCADLTTFVPGRSLDDDGSVLLKLEQGAKGILYVSQIAVGEENGLRIRIYGEKGSLSWRQEEPNSLVVRWLDRPMEIVRTGTNFSNFAPTTLFGTRIPAGHPEGFIEAFATVYRNFALALQCIKKGETPKPEYMDFPSVKDGVRGMAFIESVVESSNSQQKWLKFKS